MERRSSGFMVAFMVNFAAFLLNAGFALLWHHQHSFGPMVLNGACAVFSGTLAMINYSRYADARDSEARDEIYRRVSGRY